MKYRHLQSLEDIIVYVHGEVERRYSEIMAQRGKAVPMGDDELEDAMLGIIRRQPVSAGTLAIMTGTPVNKVIHRLRKMEKWGMVEVATKKEVMFWSAPRTKVV